MEEREIRVRVNDRQTLTVQVTEDASGTTDPPANIYNASPDCSCVIYRGQQYTFTRKQRSVIQALLQAREEGYDFLTQEALLELAGSDQLRLRELFRGHQAWGTVIVPGHECGGRLGTYRLAP